MDLLDGIKYNIRGAILGIKTPKLLFLGLLRFFSILLITFLLLGAVLYWHEEILSVIWKRPESDWLVYLWYAFSFVLYIFLAVVSMMISYLLSQLLFSVFIMDYMSRIVESVIIGKKIRPAQGEHWIRFFIYLVKQEIPRAIVPIGLTFMIAIAGLITPISPFIIFVSSISAAVFLAWDNTDLVPARRMYPFRDRVKFLRQNLMFHIGFGLLFLIPGLNMIFLSFAPVGATLFFMERKEKFFKDQSNGNHF